MSDYDSPWKEALDRYFGWFLAFFFPELHALLDWGRDYEALDSELRKIVPEGKGGKRHVDRLVKAFRRETGDARLVHVEVQGWVEDDFERRLHTYNYRIEDTCGQPVLTLVVLGDEDKSWRPAEYRHEEAGCVRTLRFPSVKLLDYADRLDELEGHDNLFGVLVVAHLVAQRTRGDDAGRKQWKLRLLRGVAERKMDDEDKRQLSRYLDWFLPLPQEVERELTRELQASKEKAMPYVTSWERMGEERGQRTGLQKGLLRGIEALLEAKFGNDGLALMSLIQGCHDQAILDQLIDAIKRAASLENARAEVARVVPPSNGNPSA